MLHEKVYKRRGKEKEIEGLQLQQHNNNNADGECCCWVPGTPAKEKKPGPVASNPEAEAESYRTGLIDLNKSIDEWQHEAEAVAVAVAALEVLEFSISVDKNAQLVELINVATPAAPQVLVSGKEPDPNNFLLPISDKNPISSPESCVSLQERDNGNNDDANNLKNLQQSGTNSPESCVWQHVQQNVQEEEVVVVRQEEDGVFSTEVENLKKGLNQRGPKQKPKRKKHRPKILVEGMPKKTPQQPKTPKPVTPNRAHETTRKRKYVRKNKNLVSGDVVVDEGVSKRRKCGRVNRRSNSDAIILLPPPPIKTCRQALNFDLENQSTDDKAIIIAIPEVVDECAFTKATECGVKAVDKCVDDKEQCENNKTRSNRRSRRRRRLNILFMRNLPIGQAQYPRRKRRFRRATRRCNLTVLTAIPLCNQLPKLPSKQAFPSENATPICSQPPKIPPKQAAGSEKKEAEVVYEPEASKNMLLTNNLEKNVAGRTVEPCVVVDLQLHGNKSVGSPLKYEDFPLASYLTGVSPCKKRKHPLELENFGLMDQTIGSQKILLEPGLGLQEGLREPRIGAPPHFQEQKIDSLAPFRGQSSGKTLPFPGHFIGALPQQNNGVLGLLPEQSIDAVEHFLDQSNGALEFFPGQAQAINSQEMNSAAEFLKEQVMYRLDQLQEQIIGPSSQLQEQNQVIQRKSLNPEDLWLTAKLRGSQEIIQVERNGFPTQKMPPRYSRGLQVDMEQQLMQPTTADIIRKFKDLTIRDGGSQLPQQYNKADGPSTGHSAVVPYQVGPSGEHGALVPYQIKEKCKKPKPEVDLDPGTLRMWNLIMNIDDGTTKDQTSNEDIEKWWQKEREVFEGRIQSFTARMHLILGDRRFKPWKGSVVDSVVGVYLTQNVSDNLSSSAYMSLAARFPLESTGDHTASDENLRTTASLELIGSNSISNGALYDSEGNMYFVTEPEPDRCCELKDRDDPFDSRIQGKALQENGDIKVLKDAVASQAFDTSSVQSLDRTQLSPTGNSKADVASSRKTCNAESFITQFSPTGNSKADVASPSQICITESSVTQLCPTGNSTADVVSPSKTCIKESSITVSTEIPRLENTNMLQDKVDGILFCDEWLDGYTTPTRIDNGNQASTSGRNDLKSDFRSISLSGFNDPFEISVSHLIQESFRTGMPQVHDATTTSKKNPRGKRKSKESKSDLKTDGTKKTTPKKNSDNTVQQDWDLLRRIYSTGEERSRDRMDSVDWEAVRCADESEIADAIKERGQQNIIAGRIKEFLNRLVELHGSIDLEWLRNVPPDKVKEYLLDIEGLGLKSVECVRLLSLQHIAFPVDVNVGRIAVRLGWVPLQPLPGDLHIHLLEEYPVMDKIQMYLWPRLCYLDQKTLYELHYQMITFGKVFCKKRSPNCGACPLRGECKHFASAVASARFALPGPSEKGIVTSEFGNGIGGNPPLVDNPIPVIRIEADPISESGYQINNCEPIIEEPQSPGPQCSESTESEIDDDFCIDDIEEIPTLRLQEREFKENFPNFMEMNKVVLQDSSALVALSAQAASMPARKLKRYARLRTEHHVYVLPDTHKLLRGFDRRDPDDPSPYLLAIWSPGETPNSVGSPQYRCNSKDSKLCNSEICYSCNNVREQNAHIVRGTILIPCRTANRGRFPLNGTYFQVNEVFADHETSNHPINVPRHMIANLRREIVCFGSSATTMFNGLEMRQIQEYFWRGFVCVRGFDRRYRCPRPLAKRLHCPPSKKEAGSKRSRDES